MVYPDMLSALFQRSSVPILLPTQVGCPRKVTQGEFCTVIYGGVQKRNGGHARVAGGKGKNILHLLAVIYPDGYEAEEMWKPQPQLTP